VAKKLIFFVAFATNAILVINTLGYFELDLILPIPRVESTRHEISQLVQRIVRDRVEARELAREVTEAVTSSRQST